jgi:hypothetical protein
VVAGSLGGPTEIITPDVDGVLAAYDCPDELSAAILRYLDDPLFGDQVGAAAKRRATDFSDRKFAIRMVNAIANLAKVDLGNQHKRTLVGDSDFEIADRAAALDASEPQEPTACR